MAYSKVVIIGGGFAGLNAAKTLGNTKHEVWVVDKSNHHLFQPLLYQVATAALSPGDIAVPIREILANYENITVLMGDVVSIDKEQQKVVFYNGEILNFDYLIAAPGARHSYFGKNEWEPFAPGLKTLSDALKIRERILLSFEKAERCDSITEAKKYLNFVIVGGGPTGVEMAGAIAEIAYQTMLKNFRRIDTTKTKIYLVEGSPTILPAFPEYLGKKAEGYLKKFGVQVITNQRVTLVSEDGVKIGETFIPSHNVLWAAGNQAAPLLTTLGVPLDRQGRVLVDPDLSIPGHPNLFVVGDAACAIDTKTGQPYPGLASVAIQQGRYVARQILRKREKKDRPPFRYFDKGIMATVGKAKAIGVCWGIKFSGLFAWLAWCVIHILYLIGFRNRITVVTHWIIAHFTNQRGVRLIYRSIDEELSSKKSP